MDNNAKNKIVCTVRILYVQYIVRTVWNLILLLPILLWVLWGLNFYKEHFCSKIGDSNFINTMLHIVKVETKLAVLNFESVLYAE